MPPDLPDTLFSLALLNVVVWSEPLMVEAMLPTVGLPGDAAGVRRFRHWLADVVGGRRTPS